MAWWPERWLDGLKAWLDGLKSWLDGLKSWLDSLKAWVVRGSKVSFGAMICRFLPDFGCFCAVLGVWYVFCIIFLCLEYCMKWSLAWAWTRDYDGLWGHDPILRQGMFHICYVILWPGFGFFCAVLGYAMSFFAWFWLFLRCFGGMICLFSIVFLCLGMIF